MRINPVDKSNQINKSIENNKSKLEIKIRHLHIEENGPEKDLEKNLSDFIDSVKSDLANEAQNLVYNKETLEKLKLQSENIYKETINLVEKLIFDQYHEERTLSSELLPSLVEKVLEEASPQIKNEFLAKVEEWIKTGDSSELAEETREKVIEIIGKEIHHMVEKDSNKVLNMIKERSQGKTGEIPVLKEAIDKGFKKVEEKIGGLPRISIKTYERTISKINRLLYIPSIKENPKKGDIFLKELIREIVIKQSIENKPLSDLEIEGLKKEIIEVLNLKVDRGILNRLEFGSPKEDSILSLLLDREELEIEISSERILEFIKNIGNDEKDGFENLIRVLERTFHELEKNLGFMPHITKETFKRSLEKLKDQYPKYKYLNPSLWPGDHTSSKEVKNLSKSKIILYFFLFLLGLFVYYTFRK